MVVFYFSQHRQQILFFIYKNLCWFFKDNVELQNKQTGYSKKCKIFLL